MRPLWAASRRKTTASSVPSPSRSRALKLYTLLPLPEITAVYRKQGIYEGAATNTMKGPAFKTELATAYPECRLVVTKETMTVEGMIKIVYDLLKDKLNIVKITFNSGDNTASQEFQTERSMDRCPMCGISMGKDGVCPKCGYRKP